MKRPGGETALEERSDPKAGVPVALGSLGTHRVGGDSHLSWERSLLAPVGPVGTRHDESVDSGSHQRPCHLQGHPWDTAWSKVTARGARGRAIPPHAPHACLHSRYTVAESRSLGLGVKSMVSAV